jgi:SOR/SNZ family
MIKSIVNAVTIPVMAKVRIGHFVEAQVRIALGFPACAKLAARLINDTMCRTSDFAEHRYRLY